MNSENTYQRFLNDPIRLAIINELTHLHMVAKVKYIVNMKNKSFKTIILEPTKTLIDKGYKILSEYEKSKYPMIIDNSLTSSLLTS